MARQAKIAKRFRFEHAFWASGIAPVAGVDEAGRGPLAGPVVAAAAILPSEWMLSGLPARLKGLNDSKQLSAEEREGFHAELTSHPGVRFACAQVEVAMIDQINILQATHRAMNLALERLSVVPEHVLVDGLRVKTLRLPHTAMVDGDCLSYSIAAASVIAKVTRDRMMIEYHGLYPAYGFHEHKGYGTPDHLAAIRQHGPCPIHRQSFSPFRMVQTELLNLPDEPLGMD